MSKRKPTTPSPALLAVAPLPLMAIQRENIVLMIAI
jgi:hypothetical protein